MDALLKNKLEAADRFVAQLVASPAGKYIAKVILHGSVAEGAARPESDVDLLVFHFGEPEIVADFCDEIGFETLLETTEIVEPLVFAWNDYRHPPSYFVYHALWRGKEVYSMDKDQLKQQEVKDLYELALDYLEAAKASLSEGRYRIAIDTAYNAAELAAKGFIFLLLDDLPSTHRGVINKFGELYIKSGRLPRELGRGLRQGLQQRNLARYVYRAQIGAEEAREVIRLADQLLPALAKEIEKTEERE